MLSPKKLKAIELLTEGTCSQKEIAKQIGIHPQTLSRWLKDPGFLSVYHKEFQLVQCRDLQTLHRLLQEAYEEFLRRLSQDEIKDISTLHLVQLMDRLHRQLKEIQTQLGKISATEDKSEEDHPLFTEEEYHALAEEILNRLHQSPQKSSKPRPE